MEPLNYRHLFYFWRIAKAGSIAKARGELGLSQPALSLQLKRLEHDLGKKLLARGRSGVELTPEGRFVFEHCERIFLHGERLAAALRGKSGSDGSALSIGVARPVSGEFVLPIMRFVKSERPELQVRLVEGTIDDMEERLRRGGVDVVIADQDFAARAGGAFRSRLAGRFPIRFMAAPGLARRLGPFPPKSAMVPVIFRSPDASVRRKLEDYLRRRAGQISALVVAEIDDPDIIRELAADGAGIAALNTYALKRSSASRRLAPVWGKEPGIEEDVWIISSAREHPDPAVRGIIGPLLTKFSLT